MARATVRKARHSARKPTSVDEIIGRQIRKRRRTLEMSQEELAGAIGVTFQQVQKYEAGTNRLSASRLARIAEALEAPIAWFFRDASSREELNFQVEQDLFTLLAALTEGSRRIQLGKTSWPRESRLLSAEERKPRRRRRRISR